MILCSGCFDGLHAGHVRYLEAAKALCEPDELLICAIAPETYIRQAKHRPARWTQADRLRTVAALGVVDATLGHPQDSVAGLIREHRPRLFVKGTDWQDRVPEDVLLACEQTGTALAFVDAPGTHVSETLVSDADALARFEAIVLAQTPAAEAWQPVTDYSFEARKAIEGQHPQLIKEVFQPPRVLDAGMGPGHLVHLLRDLDVNAFGFDTSRDATYYGDLTDPHLVTGLGLFLWAGWPLVLCREVLEHLTVRQIRQAVTNLCALSRQFVYVTTRFTPTPDHLLTVNTADDLDPTHISMLNQNFLRALFVLEGFRRRADLETRLDWQHKGRVLVYERI